MRSVATVAALLAAAVAAHAGAGVACGAPPAATTMPSRHAATAIDAGSGAADAALDTLPTLDALAARGPTDAPLMRVALRVDQAAPRSADVRADRDVCLRASFAATSPVRAWFADESGGARGEIATGASGTVPPRGPVCAKKGEALHLVMESAAAEAVTNVRAVIFAAP